MSSEYLLKIFIGTEHIQDVIIKNVAEGKFVHDKSNPTFCLQHANSEPIKQERKLIDINSYLREGKDVTVHFPSDVIWTPDNTIHEIGGMIELGLNINENGEICGFEEVLQFGYGCNMCSERIQGLIYHCDDCEDYDLCAGCYKHRDHTDDHKWACYLTADLGSEE